MKGQSRNSGIDVIGDVPWGTHICQFYQTKEDLMEILVTYFEVGLENNEYCLWVTSHPVEVEDAKDALRKAIPDFNIYLEKRQIEIIPYTEWFINEGIFDLKRVSNSRLEKLNHALENGYDGMRLSGNTTWLEKEDWNRFIEFKEQTDKSMDTYRMINLCTYFIERHNASEIIDVVVNHQFALIKRDGKWKRIESSKRKQLEEQTRQRAEEMETIMEVAPVSIMIGHDPQCKNITGNRMANELYEAQVGENISANVTDIRRYFLKDQELTADELPMQESALRDIDVRNVEFDVLLPSGECRGFLGSASPLHDDNGHVRGSVGAFIDITERKLVEKALRESEEKYRNLVETANEGILVIDAENRITYANEKMAEMLGCSREEVIGKSVRDFTEDEGKAVFENNMKKRRQGINESHEFRFITKDSLSLWTHVNSRSLFDKVGKFAGSISMLTDITKRKDAESRLKETLDNLENSVKERTAELEKAYKLLKESEAGLAEAQRIAHIGNWDWDLVTGKAYWSEELYRIYGRNLQEPGATYDELLNYIHPDDREYVDSSIKKGLIGEASGIDYRIVLSNGEERIVFAQAEVIFDEKNLPVRVKGITQDITERKRAEQAIELSEERYRIITEQTGQLVYDYNIEGDAADWAGSIEELTNYTPEEFRGMNLNFWLSCIHPEDQKTLLEKYEKCMQSGEAYRMEYRFRKKNGEYIYFEDNGIFLRDKKGKSNRVLGAVKDITERKKAELFVANIETARKKEIHHRIKNNLQVISSLLDLQSEKFRNRECVQDKEVMKAFRESQDRVTSIALIHEELHEGKGTDKLNFSPYLERLVENLFQTYRLGNTSTSLKTQLEEDIFLDMDIAVPLGIIINELVSNSLKYAFTDKNKGLIQIILCRERVTEYASTELGKGLDSRAEIQEEDRVVTNFVLTVSDDGAGIPENFNSENSSSLGLQLVTILVDQLGGKLELKRESGTEFVIRFSVKEMQ